MLTYRHYTNRSEKVNISDEYLDFCSFEIYVNEHFVVGAWNDMYSFLCGDGM